MKTVFSNQPQEVLTGLDNVIIPQFISAIPNGRTLDMTGFAEKVITAGHVIITDGKGVYKPMPVVAASGDVAAHYGTLPDGYTYAGVLHHSLLASRPAASIMIAGLVNEVASPYPIADIKEDLCAALPGIHYITEENA